MDLQEQFTLQLISIMVKNVNSFPYTSKMHSTLKDKNYITLYV